MNAVIAEKLAISIGIVSFKLLKKVSPPVSPSFTSRKNNPKNKKKFVIKIIEYFPNFFLGIKFILNVKANCCFVTLFYFF